MSDAPWDDDPAPHVGVTAADGRRGPQILALTGGDREAIQAMLRRAVEDVSQAGCAVIGVVEEIEDGGAHVVLRDLASGAFFPLTQDLGPGAGGCSLDPQGLAAACGSVEAAIAALPPAGEARGRVLVVLSKFGRQEAEGRGLTHAFHAAVAADLPVLTSVSPVVATAWAAFAGDLAAFVSLDVAAVRTWLDGLDGERSLGTAWPNSQAHGTR